MTRTITSIFFLFICYFGTAQVYWNGGAGKWSVGSNWSTGVIPTSADSVVIDTEDARVSLASGDYKIKALYLGFRSELTIDNSQILRVAGGAGDAVTSLSGKLHVDGTLDITSAARTGIILHARNEFNLALLTNSGLIHIVGSAGSGIVSGGGRIINDGKIISESNGSRGISVGHPSSNDINNDTIISRNNGEGGITVNSGRVFENHGAILIDNNSNGLLVNGSLQNYNEIRISDSDNRGLAVFQAGFYENVSQSSLLEVRKSHTGAIVAQDSEIKNSGIFNIISSAHFGLELRDCSSFKTSGFNQVTIDTSLTGIVAYDETSADLTGVNLTVKNSSTSSVRQYGTSSFNFRSSSSLTILSTGLSAYQLFDESSSIFYGSTSILTDDILGTTIFSVDDSANLTIENTAEVTIGL